MSAEEIANSLVGSVWEEAKSKSEYEIQEMCWGNIHNKYVLSDEALSLILHRAYHASLILEEVKVVIAIELRDMFLARAKK